jgi:hypothetical protein
MAVFPVVHLKIPKKPVVSREDSEDSSFQKRTESSGIFGSKRLFTNPIGFHYLIASSAGHGLLSAAASTHSCRYCFSHGVPHLLDTRRQEKPFLRHDVAIHQDCQFAMSAVDQVHLIHAGFLTQGCRQTGGASSSSASGWALPDGDLFHGALLRKKRAKCLLENAAGNVPNDQTHR